MAGVPVGALLAADEAPTVSYAPSATVFKYLRQQPRPDRRTGLLALGDPLYQNSDSSSEPGPLPDHGLLVNVVAPGSNAEAHGLRPGDVLLAYDGTPLNKREDLKAAAGQGRPVPVEVWRDGERSRRDLATGKLGVVIDPRPAPEAIAANRAMNKVILAARGGGEAFVGFARALLTSGARSVCLSLWKVDDTATALLMQRFYANLLGQRPGLAAPMPKAEALQEARYWLRGLHRAEALTITARLSGGVERGKGAKARQPAELAAAIPAVANDDRPYASPHYWAAFVLAGDPD